ncbi:MAG: STAS domain-containing protein [Chloroflexota bacterium]
MEIYVSQIEGRVPVTRLRLVGDFVEQEPIVNVAQKELDSGATHILLDLTNVPFISSMGLRAIYAIYEKLEKNLGSEQSKLHEGIANGTYKSPHLKLLNPSKNSLKALTVGGFDMFLEILDDEAKVKTAF